MIGADTVPIIDTWWQTETGFPITVSCEMPTDEPGKYVKGSSWAGREAAEAEVNASIERFKAEGH